MKLTEGKLNEARFFLSKLEQIYYEYLEALGSDEPSPPVSQYYLSAFISSARSVMWVMRYEYYDVQGWEAWYDSHKANREHEEEELLKKTNDVRIRSEKKSPLILAPNVAFNSISDEITLETDETLPKEQRKKFKAKFTEFPKEGEDPDKEPKTIEMLLEVRSFFLALEEFPNEDILKLCKSYLSFLERIVYQCKEQFVVAPRHNNGMHPTPL
jgi:hypothetical protein